MKIVGMDVLEDFKAHHADVRSAVDSWVAEVEMAQWSEPAELKKRYPSASILADNYVIFNIKGNHYRLKTQVAYQTGIVLVKMAGTHAEYMKW